MTSLVWLNQIILLALEHNGGQCSTKGFMDPESPDFAPFLLTYSEQWVHENSSLKLDLFIIALHFRTLLFGQKQYFNLLQNNQPKNPSIILDITRKLKYIYA